MMNNAQKNRRQKKMLQKWHLMKVLKKRRQMKKKI